MKRPNRDELRRKLSEVIVSRSDFHRPSMDLKNLVVMSLMAGGHTLGESYQMLSEVFGGIEVVDEYKEGGVESIPRTETEALLRKFAGRIEDAANTADKEASENVLISKDAWETMSVGITSAMTIIQRSIAVTQSISEGHIAPNSPQHQQLIKDLDIVLPPRPVIRRQATPYDSDLYNLIEPTITYSLEEPKPVAKRRHTFPTLTEYSSIGRRHTH